jgi:hypothetical protein
MLVVVRTLDEAVRDVLRAGLLLLFLDFVRDIEQPMS